MKFVDADASLERFYGLLHAHNPALIDLLNAESVLQFISAAEGGIERALKKIENGSKQYSAMGETGLSHLLADLLSSAGFRATAETNNNGHVDVVVECAFGRQWRYLGECKLYNGYSYHIDGCSQLLGYCTGREPRGFCIDFIAKPGAFEKMAKIRLRMDEELPLAQNATSSDHPIFGSFLTPHVHISGAVVEILHLACSVPNS